MPITRPDPVSLERWLRRSACGISAFFLLFFVYVALRRLRYPFELDRMESGMMTSVWRLAHGQALYSPPSMEWVPFLYAPLYFYLSLGMAKVMGLGFGALRMVSILSTVVSFGAIYALVARETGRKSAGLAAAGLFACLYSFSLGWYDVGRVDSLSVALLLLALYATRWGNPIFAALLWLLAFHAKQTLLPIGLLAFAANWQQPRRMLLGMASFAAMAVGSVVWLNHATGGWYGRYAFGTTQQLGLIPRVAALYIPVDLVGPLPVLATLLLVALMVAPPRRRSQAASFYGLMTLLVLGAVGFVRAHDGANINAVIPAYAWLAVLGGVAIARILTWLDEQVAAGAIASDAARLAAAGVWLAICLQLVGHIYQPAKWIPASGQLADRNALLVDVKAAPGDVWLLNHSYDGIVAGKPIHPEMDALDAILSRPYPPTLAEFNRMIAERHFSAILMDRAAESYSPEGAFTSAAFQAAYPLRAAASGAGAPDQPVMTYLPCAALDRADPPFHLAENSPDESRCPPRAGAAR